MIREYNDSPPVGSGSLAALTKTSNVIGLAVILTTLSAPPLASAPILHHTSSQNIIVLSQDVQATVTSDEYFSFTESRLSNHNGSVTKKTFLLHKAGRDSPVINHELFTTVWG